MARDLAGIRVPAFLAGVPSRRTRTVPFTIHNDRIGLRASAVSSPIRSAVTRPSVAVGYQLPRRLSSRRSALRRPADPSSAAPMRHHAGA